MRLRLVAFLAVLSMPLASFAQALSDKLPADTILYVGWKGAQNLPPGYDQTHLKALLDASNLPQVFNDLLPRVIQRVAQDDKETAQILQTLVSVGSPLWRHPTALTFAGLHWPNAEDRHNATPRLALICQAGPDADALAAQFEDLLTKLKAEDPDFAVIQLLHQGEFVGLTMGYPQPGAALASANPLAATPGFTTALAQVQKDPFACLYYNNEAFMTLINRTLQVNPNPNIQQLWPKIRDAAGLANLKQVAWSANFDGADWGTQAFIAAPAPRVGLMKMLDMEPISDDMLKSIPQSATTAFVARFNLAKLVTEIRTAVGNVDPDAQRVFDQGLGVAQLALAMNVQKDLLEPLGDQWALYVDPELAGNGLLGFTLVNKLNKPTEANRALTKLEFFADNMLNAHLRHSKMRISFEQTKVADLTVHYVALPVVSPSWTIQDGTLYGSLYPQVTVAAASQPGSGKSILDNKEFQALRQRLNVPNAAGYVFIDLPRSANDGYQGLLALTQAGLGMADLMGVKTPPLVLPTLPKIKQHLAPSGAAWWTDDAGLHLRSVEPFPASGLLTMNSNAAIMGSASLAAAALPALSNARSQANRVKSASNLRQIGQGIMLYAADHKGAYPANLGTLVTDVELNADVFVSPLSTTRVPPQIRNAPRDQQAAWINANADYLYIGANAKPTDGPGRVLAYEKPQFAREGMNVLFNDGHVEWMPVPRAMQAIQKANAPAPR